MAIIIIDTHNFNDDQAREIHAWIKEAYEAGKKDAFPLSAPLKTEPNTWTLMNQCSHSEMPDNLPG